MKVSVFNTLGVRNLLYMWAQTVPAGVYYLSKMPVELHAFSHSIAALNEPWPAVHIHQALVVIIVNGGAQDAHE